MNTDQMRRLALIQNLRDAGCTGDIIDAFMKKHAIGDTASQASLLAQQRNVLLSRVHEEQNKLDCLDYLLFQMKKNKPASMPPSPSPHKHH